MSHCPRQCQSVTYSHQDTATEQPLCATVRFPVKKDRAGEYDHVPAQSALHSDRASRPESTRHPARTARTRTKKAAERMLREERYAIACSDAHRPADVAVVAESIRRLQALAGDRYADRLLRENPSRLLSGEGLL